MHIKWKIFDWYVKKKEVLSMITLFKYFYEAYSIFEIGYLFSLFCDWKTLHIHLSSAGSYTKKDKDLTD